MTASGMLSSFLPPRAARIESAGLVAPDDPCRFGSVPGQRHGEPCRPREITATRDRENHREFRNPVERLWRRDKHRTAALLLVSRCRIETDEPDFAALLIRVSLDELAADAFDHSSHSCSSSAP
jgi:hypothetical protein